MSPDGQPASSAFQSLIAAPFPVKIACVGLLALGGASANLFAEQSKTSLGEAGSVLLAAVPLVAALFAIGTLIKLPWRNSLIGSVVWVTGALAFEHLPRVFERWLNAGFLCNVVAGVAALSLATVVYFLMSSLLRSQPAA